MCVYFGVYLNAPLLKVRSSVVCCWSWWPNKEKNQLETKKKTLQTINTTAFYLIDLVLESLKIWLPEIRRVILVPTAGKREQWRKTANSCTCQCQTTEIGTFFIAHFVSPRSYATWFVSVVSFVLSLFFRSKVCCCRLFSIRNLF